MQSSTTPKPGYQWESDKLTVDTTNGSQEVSLFPAGDHKAHINRRAQRHSKHKTEQKHKKIHKRTVSNALERSVKHISLEDCKQVMERATRQRLRRFKKEKWDFEKRSDFKTISFENFILFEIVSRKPDLAATEQQKAQIWLRCQNNAFVCWN